MEQNGHALTEMCGDVFMVSIWPTSGTEKYP